MSAHPIYATISDDLRRSRLTVFFRLLLVIPHMVWVFLWVLPVVVCFLINWFVTLFAGRPAQGLHNFVAAYVRYQAHLYAYLTLVANPFPGFVGKAGSYPFDVVIGPPERQNRWKTFFRIFLAYPALLVGGMLSYALLLATMLAWFAALFTGVMPRGLRNLNAYILHYTAQSNSYMFLLTDRYPNSDPFAMLAPADVA